MLSNPIYAGRIRHRDKVYDGQHEAVVRLRELRRAVDVEPNDGGRPPDRGGPPQPHHTRDQPRAPRANDVAQVPERRRRVPVRDLRGVRRDGWCHAEKLWRWLTLENLLARAAVVEI